jgi:soluble lytic murein transglycosylase
MIVVVFTGSAAFAGERDFHDVLVKASALNRLGFFADAESVLTDVAGKSGKPSNQQVQSSLVMARAILGQKSKVDRALPVMSDIDLSSVPAGLADVVLFEKARAMLAGGERPAGMAALGEMISRFPDSDRTLEARLLSGEASLEAGDTGSAAGQAEAVIRGRARRSSEARARLLLARSRAEPDRGAALRRLFIEMPDTVAATQTGIREEDLTSSELRKRADSFFDAVDFFEAQRVLQKLWDGGDKSPELAYRLARSHLIHVRDNPQEALDLLLYARKSGVAVDAEGTFLLARAYARLEDYDSAEKHFRQYIQTGASKNRMLAHYYLAWLPYDHREYEKALPEMDKFLKKFRNSERYSYMLWFKGWSLYRMKRYDDALKVFGSMKKLGNCLVAGKAMYWGGMAWRNLGNKREAAAWMNEVIQRYPLTWYSVLAAKRLKQWNGTPLPDWITGSAAVAPEPEPLWKDDKMPDGVNSTLSRVRTLAEVGEPRRAWNLYSSVAKTAEKRLKGADRARLMVTVYDATEQYNKLFSRSGAEFGRYFGKTPTRQTAIFWMTMYPKAYRSLVSAATEKFGIPELWPYAIMRQESRYDSKQISYTAALGVMQMIAATARIVGKGVGVPWELDTFFEPGRNVLFGTWYLSQLYKDFKGQIVFASAAYNSGAPAIKKFMNLNKGLPLDEMVEMIPYNEGRNYCRKVAEHLIRYAAIYLGSAERRQLYDKIFPEVVDYDLGSEIDY